ncbi:hypothetical protein GDO78_020822 [Eleutherodactylus coqui]|uniref:Taste receptor type 2 n=1 Tax=Eleutherodactylus coqui TaxID=57060 RepID=A0A8J6E5L1_ELECQ|nr:hypothetical protein GDO78_020822 [Eleutherodactylus coqui]
MYLILGELTILMDVFNSLSFVTLILLFAANIFIIVVNILDFFKTRKLLLSDLLISGISTANLLHDFLKAFLHYYSQVISKEYLKIGLLVTLCLTINTLLFSAILSIHFCLKIVNINHRFYICLQRSFPKLFPGIIITFLLGCFFLNLHFSLGANEDCLTNTTLKVIQVKKSARCYWSLFITMTISALGTFLCSVSALTILISLLKHMKRIQENTEGSGSPNMEAHIRAIKTITSLLAANILICTSVFVIAFSEIILIFLFDVLVSVSHIFSSYFFIKGTKKLEKTLEEILNHCSCFKAQNQ